MTSFFSKSKKLIINTDIDGILSGLILVNFADCEIVGFSNSDNTVWIDETKIGSIYDAIYIDMFVADSAVKCIDQHIVSVNEEHWKILKANPNKLNPNFDNPRFHLPIDSYYNKYPFGTIHYLIALLESEGITIELDLMKQNGQLKFIDLLLRADDAMKTTVDSKYTANASLWWNWLYQKADKASSINTMMLYLNNLNDKRVKEIKYKITSLFTDPLTFCCTRSDGGYKSITDLNGKLFPNVLMYINYLSEVSGLKCFDLNLKLIPQFGSVYRISLTEKLIHELINFNTINGEKLFSYAFVRSANRNENFSYTVM